jgi:O-antigen ligase
MMPNPSFPSRDSETAFAAEPVPVPSAFWNMAFACWLATVFILYSRFFDLVLRGFYIPRVVLSLMILFFLVSGKPLVFLSSTVGKIMLMFVCWVTFTVLFSQWKGGSLPYFEQLLQSLFFFAIAAGLPNVIADVRRTCYTLGFSGILAALMSFHWGMNLEGRLALNAGSFADPNYFAMGLAAVIPFVWEMATAAQSKVLRIFAWLSMPVLVLVLAKTGSRGAMMAFALMLLFLLIISPVKTKIALLLVSAIGLAVLLAVVPSYLMERYVTFFTVNSAASQPSGDSGDAELDRLRGDASSAEERRRLLQESVNLTLEHPLVGVGPGCFQSAVYDEAKAKGIRHNVWLMTHNSYTQISSETGFPGLILLLCLFGASFKSIWAVLKSAKPHGEKPNPAAEAAAKSLLLSLVVVSVSVFFLAVGYDFVIYLWCGLAAGLRRVYDQIKVDESAGSAESEETSKVTSAFAPAYATVRSSAPQRRTPTVSGRAVRFNRFR